MNSSFYLSLSHLQVCIGSALPVLSLQFTKYQKWIDLDWVTSIWWFTPIMGLQLEVENQWVPKLARTSDRMIMDVVLDYNFTLLQ
jgi:hypothetical protein